MDNRPKFKAGFFKLTPQRIEKWFYDTPKGGLGNLYAGVKITRPEQSLPKQKILLAPTLASRFSLPTPGLQRPH